MQNLQGSHECPQRVKDFCPHATSRYGWTSPPESKSCFLVSNRLKVISCHERPRASSKKATTPECRWLKAERGLVLHRRSEHVHAADTQTPPTNHRQPILTSPKDNFGLFGRRIRLLGGASTVVVKRVLRRSLFEVSACASCSPSTQGSP